MIYVTKRTLPEYLLVRIGRGDKSAVSDCIDQYGGLVYSLAKRLTTRQADAEDAVQEIFISLWKSANRFDPSKSSEATFVSMVARRRLIDMSRKKQKGIETVEADSIDQTDQSAGSDPTRRAELSDDAGKVLQALNELSDQQQRVIKLSVYDDLTHPQIAERMNLPLGTIKTHIRRGLIHLRERCYHFAATDGGGNGR